LVRVKTKHGWHLLQVLSERSVLLSTLSFSSDSLLTPAGLFSHIRFVSIFHLDILLGI
jgi:hypothetical protein